MIDPKEFAELKRAVDDARGEYERSKGALGELTGRLKKEFGCATLGDAERLLKQMEKEAKDLEAQYAKQKAAYIKTWKSETE
jgi:hypothetical protein